jgi:hypothetical protein
MSEVSLCFTEMRSGSEAGWLLRLIDVVHRSTVGLKVMNMKKEMLERLQRLTQLFLQLLSEHAGFIG